MKNEMIDLSNRFLNSIEINKPKEAFYKEIEISLNDIKSFSVELYNSIINNPEETITIIEEELCKIIEIEEVRIRLIDYDMIKETRIKDIRAEHINHLLLFRGHSIQVSDVRPQVITARFECPSCGTYIVVPQVEKVFREPKSCSCGNTKNLKLISKKMVDSQRIVVAEESGDPEQNSSPKISVFLKEALTNPEKGVFENIGKEMLILGILQEVPVSVNEGKISTRFDLVIEANNFKFGKD